MIIAIDLRCLDSNLKNGVSVYAYNLVRQLILNDSENYYKLFTNRQTINYLFDDLESKNFKFYNFNIPNKILNFLLIFFKFPKLDKIIDGADIFLLLNFNFIALSKNTKLITTVHDLSFVFMTEFLNLKRKIWHYALNVKRTIKTSSKIIAVSKNTKNDIINLYKVNSEKVEVVYPGIQKITIENTPKSNYILSIATLEPRKNLTTLIEAFIDLVDKNSLVDWKLVILGQRGWLNKKIISLIKNNKYSKFIDYINSPDQEKVAYYLNRAKIFVWPSYYEGFGFPPQEALNLEIPIIASFNSSLTETLKNKAIFINPFNVNELTEAMELIINKRPKPASSKIFDWQISAQKLINIFKYL